MIFSVPNYFVVFAHFSHQQQLANRVINMNQIIVIKCDAVPVVGVAAAVAVATIGGQMKAAVDALIMGISLFTCNAFLFISDRVHVGLDV
jgi:hypothetical protein